MHLTDTSIDLPALLGLARPSDGGVCLFVGVVRNRNAGRETIAIEYEAYAEMAEAQIDAIVRDVQARRPETRLTVRHRVGRLRVGEASVAVLATAPHRDDAFAACRETIDRIKSSVPIWKKEHHPDGSSDWVDPTKADADAG